MPEKIFSRIPDEEKMERLEKLMMCDVPDRYALLYYLGWDHRVIATLALNGTPSNTANLIYRTYKSLWEPYEQKKDFWECVLASPLPNERIPDIPSLKNKIP